MKKLIQPYYIIAILIGIGLFYYDQEVTQAPTEIFGFAENRDTEVNFNYPVTVKSILVKEGQATNKGEVLFRLQRVQPKEQYADENDRIAELRAEAIAWKEEKKGDLEVLKSKYYLDKKEIEAQIGELEKEISAKNILYSQLKSLEKTPVEFHGQHLELENKREESLLLDSLYYQEKSNLENIIRLGENPFLLEVKRLESQRQFDEDQKIQNIEITAPFSGLVGSIQCREEEHVPSFKTLLTYYEPNPSIVKGFIHEEIMMQLKIGKKLIIRSTNDYSRQVEGEVIGLGSRVIEIPSRLRKIEDIKTYGREVLISIPRENSFIQKEKVLIEL